MQRARDQGDKTPGRSAGPPAVVPRCARHRLPPDSARDLDPGTDGRRRRRRRGCCLPASSSSRTIVAMPPPRSRGRHRLLRELVLRRGRTERLWLRNSGRQFARTRSPPAGAGMAKAIAPPRAVRLQGQERQAPPLPAKCLQIRRGPHSVLGTHRAKKALTDDRMACKTKVDCSASGPAARLDRRGAIMPPAETQKTPPLATAPAAPDKPSGCDCGSVAPTRRGPDHTLPLLRAPSAGAASGRRL